MTGRITVFTSTAAPLAKRWELAEGQPQKTVAAELYTGTYRVQDIGSVGDVVALLGELTTHNAISASTPADGSLSGQVCTQKRPVEGAVCRSKNTFTLAGAGLGVIDCDDDGVSRAELWEMLLAVCPGLAGAGVVWLPSGSSHIHHGDHDLTGLRGQHIYVLVRDVGDWPRVLKTLAARLWLAGHGRIKTSKAGSQLVRCPLDLAVGDAARLIFSAGAECVPPLEQRQRAPVVLAEGGFLDTREVVPELSAEELGRYESMVARAKTEGQPTAVAAREAHIAGETARRMTSLLQRGMSAQQATDAVRESITAALAGTLLADFELTLVDDAGRQTAVTVGEVLADPDRYDGRVCLDPVNPEHRGGSPDGRLFLMSASPIVYSLDDSGKVYRLRRAKVRIVAGAGQRGALVDQLVGVVAANDRVFATDTGPVIVDGGRLLPLTVARLTCLVDQDVTLYRAGKRGEETPTDLGKDVAELVLAKLG